MTRFQVIPAAYVALLRSVGPEVQVLLHLRQATGYMDGHWALLAGHVESGESVTQAAVREAYEESGVRIELSDLIPLTAMHRTQPGGGPIEQRVDFFFSARLWQGTPRIQEPAKAADMSWFPLTGLPEPTVPHESAVLAGLASGGVPAVITWGI